MQHITLCVSPGRVAEEVVIGNSLHRSLGGPGDRRSEDAIIPTGIWVNHELSITYAMKPSCSKNVYNHAVVCYSVACEGDAERSNPLDRTGRSSTVCFAGLGTFVTVVCMLARRVYASAALALQ